MKKFLSSLLLAFTTMCALPAFADDLCKNLFDKNTIATGGYIDSTSGSWVPSNYNESDFIPVIPGATYVKQGDMFAGENSCVFYDANKNWISSRYWFSSRGIVTVPSGAAYMRMLVRNEFLNTTQLERGSTATSYVPYNPLCATCQGIIKTYESAVGTVSQNGTPTPTNPVEPTFYQQGDMILRKVGNYADSYDATTGKITRRVGVKVLNSTANYTFDEVGDYYRTTVSTGDSKYSNDSQTGLSTHFPYRWQWSPVRAEAFHNGVSITSARNLFFFEFLKTTFESPEDWKTWLAEQEANGTPVTVYYPLATETTEDIGTTYCAPNIKIATTAYNSARFNPVKTDLDSAVATIREIVTKTINQTAAIASLQADKQTRPEDACPAGKKCLLVETEENGVIVPHWFPIIEAPEE